MDWSAIHGVVMDMDGVLWRGNVALPGIQELFNKLQKDNIPFALATNNSGASPDDYVNKLARFGVENVPTHQIITSGTATVTYMKKHYPTTTRVYVMGMDGLRHLITEAGYEIVERDAQLVVAGGDFGLTYDKLKWAALNIRAGADFIGTNDDATYPTPEGLSPGSGSLLAALRTATDRQPIIMGKPNAPMFQAALHVMGTAAENTLMIGDRLNTDVIGAQAVGLKTALVLTGVTTREQLAESTQQPDGVYDGVPALLADWEQSNA